MKLTQRIITFVLFSSTLAFTNTASAYLQLTYTSDPLHFIQGYLGGEPYDDIGSDEPPYPTFNVIFNNISDTTSAQTLGSTGNVSASEWPAFFGDIPITNGSVTLGESGIPTAWNFSLAVTHSTPGFREVEYDSEGEIISGDSMLPSKTSWLFESSYGAGTCNCEKYRYDDDLYIERPYYSWAYANTIGFLYGGDSSPSNWAVTKVDVPEPKSYLLFAFGLIMICVRKMRSKKII